MYDGAKMRRLLALTIFALLGQASPATAQSPALDEAIRLAVAAEYEQALALFQLESARFPEDPLRHYLVGMTEFKLEQYRTARGRFLVALEKKAEFPQVFYWLARSQQELGEASEALATLERGLERFPRNQDLVSLERLLRSADAGLEASGSGSP